jgi:predicted nucleotidyltransferase component of viral defense system
MIRKLEIQKWAGKHGVPLSTIQRDYAQNMILDSLYALLSDSLAFKGGTCIRKIYIEDYRFSDDLDFTLLSDMNKETLDQIILDTVRLAREKSGIEFSEDIKTERNPNGYVISTYFKNLVGGRNSIKIKMDVTNEGHEKIMFPLEARKIINPYTDTLESKIITYSLEEITAEKIRSLFQRTRPRDLYDVYRLWDWVNIDEVKDAFNRKCEYKNIEPDMEDLKRRKDDFGNAWTNSLRHQLKVLPDFDKAYEDVKKKIEYLIN